MPYAQTKPRRAIFQNEGLEYAGSRSVDRFEGADSVALARRDARASERVSSPVTQELEACDACWRNEPRNAPHGCQKPQRS